MISPWIYQWGKSFAEWVRVEECPALVEWLGAACGRADFGRFFDRSLLLSALAGLPFLLRRVRKLRSREEPHVAGGLWHLPPGGFWRHIGAGFLIAAGILLLLGGGLAFAGAFEWRSASPGIGRILTKALVPAVMAALLEEWLFRGVLLGLCLKFARTSTALIGISLLFAFLHFLKLPDGVEIADPSGLFAGFELLGKILLHFTDPLFFVTDFATLFAVGWILAWARVTTGSLWFSIALHAGWIFAFKTFNLFLARVPENPWHPWGVGDSLRSGLLPMLALAATFWICRKVLSNQGAARS